MKAAQGAITFVGASVLINLVIDGALRWWVALLILAWVAASSTVAFIQGMYAQ